MSYRPVHFVESLAHIIWCAVADEFEGASRMICGVDTPKASYGRRGIQEGDKRTVTLYQRNQTTGIERILIQFVFTNLDRWAPTMLELFGSKPVDSWSAQFRINAKIGTKEDYFLTPYRQTSKISGAEWQYMTPQQHLQAVWACIERGSPEDPYEQAGDEYYYASQGESAAYRFGRNGRL